MNKKLQTFIDELKQHSEEKVNIIMKVRKIYKDIQPAVGEKFIYGGIGKFRRHLKAFVTNDIAEKNVRYFVNQIVNFRP